MFGFPPGQRNVVPGGVEAEMKQILANFNAMLAKHKLSVKDVISCTASVVRPEDANSVTTIWTDNMSADIYPPLVTVVPKLARGAAVALVFRLYKPCN